MNQIINNIGFGAQGHVKKTANHRSEGFEGSNISKSKSYKFKLEQNNLQATASAADLSNPRCFDDKMLERFADAIVVLEIS